MNITVPKLRSPIVLVHGLFGFDRLHVAGATIVNYFPGIRQLLEAAGNRVLIPALTPTGAVQDRAKQLQTFLMAHSAHEPVHIFAHSMGGLDARYLISRLDMADQVLTLTTIGTPHRGTSFADWGVGRFARLIRPLLESIGIPHQAFYDLTRPRCAIFNREVPMAANVRYFSVAGRHDGHLLQPEWLLPFHIVREAEGENDGVVATESAHYGEACDVWEGDHLSLVNWINPLTHFRGVWRDSGPRYASLVRRLADLGY